MKRLGTLEKIVGVLTAIGLFFLPLKKVNADPYFYADAGLDVVGGTMAAQVENVPEYIRDVPIHPDDLFKADKENIAPIEDKKISLFPLFMTLGVKAGVGITYDRLDLRIGPKLGFVTNGNTGRAAERNYLNAPGTDQRGEGAALTFYNLSLGQEDADEFCFIPGFSVRAAFSDLEWKEFNYFAEISSDFLYELYLENGWDRYNHFQVKDKYKLADIINHTIKVGISLNQVKDYTEMSMGAFVGVSFPQVINQTELFKDVDLTMYASGIAGIEFNVGLSSKQ